MGDPKALSGVVRRTNVIHSHVAVKGRLSSDPHLLKEMRHVLIRANS